MSQGLQGLFLIVTLLVMLLDTDMSEVLLEETLVKQRFLDVILRVLLLLQGIVLVVFLEVMIMELLFLIVFGIRQLRENRQVVEEQEKLQRK